MSNGSDEQPGTREWRNEPTQWERQGAAIHVQADAGTDFWRKTHDGGIRDNGHFYVECVQDDFTARVKVSGRYRDQYDQAGLMARADATTWLKCGVEYVDGAQLASAVVTRDWSDWSVVPIGEPATVWWRLQRHEQTFEVAYSLDGEVYQTLRQAFLTELPGLEVGIMACAPKGSGFSVAFEEFTVENK